MKLQQLHAAKDLKDLLVPVSNQLEAPKGRCERALECAVDVVESFRFLVLSRRTSSCNADDANKAVTFRFIARNKGNVPVCVQSNFEFSRKAASAHRKAACAIASGGPRRSLRCIHRVGEARRYYVASLQALAWLISFVR